jgi:hypothetical protein
VAKALKKKERKNRKIIKEIRKRKTLIFLIIPDWPYLFFYLSVGLEWDQIHYYCSHLLTYCTIPG